jgi:hypothetical protein
VLPTNPPWWELFDAKLAVCCVMGAAGGGGGGRGWEGGCV